MEDSYKSWVWLDFMHCKEVVVMVSMVVVVKRVGVSPLEPSLEAKQFPYCKTSSQKTVHK